MEKGTYLLDKAYRFMSVAENYLEDEEYKDIVAFNVHMALELSFSFVVENLLRNYKPPMYMAYKREFPVQATHNLSHVCYVLGNYVDFPTYLSFVVMQMTGWCVNSRYAEDFADSVEMQNLRLIYNAVKRFLRTLSLLVRVKHVDAKLSECQVQGKLAYYKGKLYVAAEDGHWQDWFTQRIEENKETISDLFLSSQEDYKFICAFMSNIEMTCFKQVLVKLMSYCNINGKDMATIREGLGYLHIQTYEEFMDKLGGYAGKYGVNEYKFYGLRG